MESISVEIRALRKCIRYARDQKLDDRCWLDYNDLYALLPGTDLDNLNRIKSYEESMQRCTAFYENRRANNVKPISPDTILNPESWNNDLIDKPNIWLALKREKIIKESIRHRDIPFRKITLADDERLYNLLPEKIPVDARLPQREDFLGTSKACAGCPNFWKSHADCPSNKHNLHIWGPCKD